MARLTAMHKPGERVPDSGTYYCYICALRDETSTCQMQQGEMLLACPKCLERKVPEWDLTWKLTDSRPGKRFRISSLWPGSLGRAG